MTWDQYKAPAEPVAFGEREADLIADEEFTEVVALNAKIAGKPVDYGTMLKMLRDVARSSAVRGFNSGYNHAVDEVARGNTLVRIAVTKKQADQR